MQSFFRRVSHRKRHFIRGFLIGLIISVVVTPLAWLGHFRFFERGLTDLLQSATFRKAKDVAILFITEEEYKRGFNATSPLSRKRLGEIVDVLAKLQARVIALDIDISDQTPEEDRLAGAIERSQAGGIPVVVVGNLKKLDSPSSRDSPFSDLPYGEGEFRFIKSGLQLYEHMTPGSQWEGKVTYGGTVFGLDTDHVFRKAEALYLVKLRDSDPGKGGPGRPEPSFPVAVAAAYNGTSWDKLTGALQKFHRDKRNTLVLPDMTRDGRHNIHIHTEKGNRITPRFVGNYRNFEWAADITRLLEDYGEGKPGAETIFKNKAVIVGGTFDKRDAYMTPMGRMSGVEIIANITQSIVDGTLITHTNFLIAFGIEVALGALVALTFILTSRLWATLICALSLIPAVAAASILAFSSFYYWFDFSPTIVGVIIHGWIKKLERER